MLKAVFSVFCARFCMLSSDFVLNATFICRQSDVRVVFIGFYFLKLSTGCLFSSLAQ